MPIVTIQGVPLHTPKDQLRRLVHLVQGAIAGVPELNIISKQVSVFIPSDLLEDGLGEEIIVTVVIYAKPGRTDEVFKRMSFHVRACIMDLKFFPDALVEVNPVIVEPKHCNS